ncbi:MAG: hypothetical protein ACXVNM_08060 [Bacteroidia bacterium]
MISCSYKGEEIICSSGRKSISLFPPSDLLVTAPEKLVATIQSRLSLNKKVFARNCEVKRIEKGQAQEFLNKYHLMNSTQSASNYGLFLKDELLAVASFSKGRKMNRLPGNKRSFELIRFCSKDGITVTGGLTRLLKNFCREKEAGDIMTYIDKQFSSGQSFIKAGFVKHSETAPHSSLINKKTFERIALKDESEVINEQLFYRFKNEGNLKLVFTCDQ